jgi:hypothetical protein
MQIVLRCGKCGKMAISEDEGDTCLEIDAKDMQIRFVCRHCKKENTISLASASKTRPLPQIGMSRF